MSRATKAFTAFFLGKFYYIRENQRLASVHQRKNYNLIKMSQSYEHFSISKILQKVHKNNKYTSEKKMTRNVRGRLKAPFSIFFLNVSSYVTP